MEQFSIGIDIGGTKVAYGLLDSQKRIVARKEHPADNTCSSEVFFTTIAANIRTIMADNHIEQNKLKGIGIGMPSFILFNEGHIVKTTNLTNIRDFPARSFLMDKLDGIRIVIDNDANTAAIAEHRHGAGRGFDNMLYCPVGTGISTGIIINGTIFRGSYGWAGETGHMILTPHDGVECGCENRGCFMSWSSGSMIIKHIQKWIDAGEKTLITDLAAGEKPNCNHLVDAYNQGDILAHKAVDQMITVLGIWTYNLYVTFNINCFVFGGGLIKMFRDLKNGERKTAGLLDAVKKVFDDYNKNEMPVYFKEAELTGTALLDGTLSGSGNLPNKWAGGDDFGIIGAAELLF